VISAPQILIAFRAVCAPAIFVLACFRFPGVLLAAIVGVAFVTDVLDGMLARRFGTVTPSLRLADTIVDTVFYVAAAIALKVAVPTAYSGLWFPLVVLIVVHVSRTTFELTKFGRVAPYHMWSSKALGVLIVAALISVFVSGTPNALVAVALWAGIINELEGFAASALLREWRADVPSVVHAYKWRVGVNSTTPQLPIPN
jgi:CDP-diacylglycerol--glycerol-3-phosphate 3-phosphatidyltransferase